MEAKIDDKKLPLNHFVLHKIAVYIVFDMCSNTLLLNISSAYYIEQIFFLN